MARRIAATAPAIRRQSDREPKRDSQCTWEREGRAGWGEVGAGGLGGLAARDVWGIRSALAHRGMGGRAGAREGSAAGPDRVVVLFVP